MGPTDNNNDEQIDEVSMNEFIDDFFPDHGINLLRVMRVSRLRVKILY